MVTVPPSGMASRALTARLSSASSIWLASASAAGRSVGRSNSIWTVGPIERRSRSPMPVTSDARSTGLGSSAWRRANASRRCVNAAPRCAPCTAPSSRRSVDGFAGTRLRSSSRLPSTAVSRLLKSWATPPVSSPIDSIFCMCRNCSSVRARSAICAISSSWACWSCCVRSSTRRSRSSADCLQRLEQAARLDLAQAALDRRPDQTLQSRGMKWPFDEGDIG